MNLNNIRIADVQMCIFKIENGHYEPIMDNYPVRYCVIDTDRRIMVDIKTCLQYPYLPTWSLIYVMEAFKNNLKEGEIVGAMPLALSSCSEENCNLTPRAMEIIKLLRQGVTFPDGNKELSNEEFLTMVEHDKEEKMKKIKKLNKKGKLF